MKYLGTLILLAAVFTAGFFGARLGGNDEGAAVVQAETAYERVMRTGQLKCGWYPYQPGLIVDPATAEKSGIIYDVMNNIAERLKLELIWQEEVGLGSMLEGMQVGRYDLICASLWALADRAPHATYGEPLWYSGVGVYVQADDRRFDGNIAAINSPDVTISAIDGSIPMFIAKQDFPNADVLSMTDMTDYTHNLLNVAQDKADVTFVEVYQAEAFLARNPGTIRNIAADEPIRLYPNSVVLPQHDYAFNEMINIALREQLKNGYVDKIIDKYEEYPGAFYRVAKPYEEN